MPVTPDDENFPSDEDFARPDEPLPETFSELVQAHPIGAVIGAFVAGFLISRLI
jgi:hypothetical protein